MSNPLEVYLKDLCEIHSTGAAVAETSYYPALSNLLNETGKSLKPKVRCVVNPANRGAGLPDVGLFTAEQIRKNDPNPMQGQLPARGVVEVKGPAEDVAKVAQSEQVKRYSAKYGVVLVTNYRDFLLLGRDAQGNPLPMESYTLADTEAAFWQLAAHPKAAADWQGARFCEYLARVMQSNAPLSAPQDLAWFLASYARDAKARVEAHKDLAALAAVRNALEEALGMKFSGDKGEHFFRSTLVQTIFYGVFSAWVLWHREQAGVAQPPAAGKTGPLTAGGGGATQDKFDWRVSAFSLRVPFIRALYEQVATPKKLGDLGLVEVLDWTTAALNRVDRAAFFQKFQDEHAVQYFYEPFLEAFDPELRKELGVWYTPPEIVKYQVARVDTVLRNELGLADGLADPSVVVLDPCCGTAAYLVEVLRKIAETLKAKGGDALIASDLKKAAMTRVFGFEILPAPFVVSHLQLGLMLYGLGAPLSDGSHVAQPPSAVRHSSQPGAAVPHGGSQPGAAVPHGGSQPGAAVPHWGSQPGAVVPHRPKEPERVGVYLTNSLTGWEPPKEPKQTVLGFMEELQQEKDAAEKVKREARVLVILGNPPYNAFAGVSPEEEQGLVEPYKKGLNAAPAAGGWGIKKFNLDDLYIRFFRLAERRIVEMNKPAQGVVSFISNHSYLSDPSFVVMRQRFLAEFDTLWFDGMNGDSRETGKLTPEGEPDPSVFSTEYNHEGIRVGTAVCVMVRRGRSSDRVSLRSAMRAETDLRPGAAQADVAQPPSAVEPDVAQPLSAVESDVAQPPSAVECVRKGKVFFRQFWGVGKRQELLDSIDAQPRAAVPRYVTATPSKENRYSFRPEEVSAAYNAWPKLPDLCEVAPSNGLMEKRGGALIDMDRAALEARMKDYFNAGLSWDDYKARQTALVETQARFDPAAARKKALAAEGFDAKRLLRYALRPFEVRWCYYTGVRPVWNEPRPALWEQCFEGNAFLMCRPAGVANPEGIPFFFTGCLGDNDFLRGHAYYFPLRLAASAKGKTATGQSSFLNESGVAQPPSAVRAMNGPQAPPPMPHPTANLSAAARAYLAALGVKDIDGVAQPPSAVRHSSQPGAAVRHSSQPGAAVPHRGAQAGTGVPHTTAASAVLSAKCSPAEYRRNLPHIQSAEKPIYVTFSTFKRWTLPESARGLVLRHCLHDHGKKYWLHAAIVMPDHVHMILSAYRDAAGRPFGLPEILSGVKGASAHAINKLLKRKGHVWQDESFDHVLRSDENLAAKEEYVRNNPVRTGFVPRAEDWPWFWGEWMDSMAATAEGGCATSAATAEGGCATPAVTAEGGCATYEMIWLHALAVGYSPAYLAENADGIRRDWPRIPLPDTRKALEASAALGRQVAALLDTEADVPGVTTGDLEPIIRTVGVLTKVGGGNLNPDAADLAVTAGWGHAGKEGVTMPAKGRIVRRPYGKDELDALRNAAEARGLSLSKVIALLGAETCDVYLNEKAYWKNIPANVWEFYIGGYQVIKKWLSYREEKLLGRALKAEEAREVTGMARRLTRIVLLQPTLDANYQLAAKHAYAWPKHSRGDS